MFAFFSDFLRRSNRNKVEPEKQITQVSYLITNGTYTRVTPSTKMIEPRKSILASRTFNDSSQKDPSTVEQINDGVIRGRNRMRILSRIAEGYVSAKVGGSGEAMVMIICPSPEPLGDKKDFFSSSSPSHHTAILPSHHPHRESTDHIASIKRRRITHIFPGILLSTSTMAPRRKTFL